MSLHFHPLEVCAVQADTDEAVLVSFAVPASLQKQFSFNQGQYLTLRQEIDGEEVRRSYSICAAVGETLRIGVRKVPGGLFSNWLANEIKIGRTLQVMPPQGRFFVPLDPNAQRHYLGLAGGSGITPILSIMKTVLAHEPASQFTLLYGNRKQQSTMFKEELEDIKNRYLDRVVLHYIFSDEHTDAPMNNGVLNRQKISDFLHTLVPVSHIDHAFVCGPYQMNDEAYAALQQSGMPAERIHIERFGAPPSDSAGHSQEVGHFGAQTNLSADVKQACIVVVRDGKRYEINCSQDEDQPSSLLEAVAAAGLELPYSCKSGVCGTCCAKLLEGRVRMARNFALDQNTVAAHFILACQAYPLTERVVISFDER